MIYFLAGLLAAGVLVTLLAWPLITVVIRSIGEPWWEHYQAELTDPHVRAVLWRTLVAAAATTAITLILAYPTAYYLLRARQRTRVILVAFLILPYLTSFVVRTYVWMAILGRSGPVVWALQRIGFEVDTLIGTLTGVVVVLIHVFLPLMIFTVYVSMRQVPPTHASAAQSLGARPSEAFFRVFIPQTAPGIVSGSVLVFILTAGMYITPALIGGPAQSTLAMLIHAELTSYPFSWGDASVLSLMLLAVVAATLTLAARRLRIAAIFGDQSAAADSGKHRPRSSYLHHPAGRNIMGVLRSAAAAFPRRSYGMWIARCAVGAAILLVPVPLVYLVAISFQPLRLLAPATRSLSLRWYGQVLADERWIGAALTSLYLLVIAVCLAVSLGYLLARAVTQTQSRTIRSSLTALALSPLIVPSIMYGTGMFSLYTDLGLVGNTFAIGLAHGTLGLPFAFVNVLNGLAKYDNRLDDAAASLGASRTRTLRRVRVPLIFPAVLLGAGTVALVSLDEFIVTLFLGGVRFETLPLRMWVGARDNLSPELAVVGVLLTVLVGVAVAVGYIVKRYAPKVASDEVAAG